MSSTAFVGSIPQKYDSILGPFLFEPYAKKLAARVAELNPPAVLKLACGTGIDARAVKTALPNTRLVATDLNQAMIDIAQTKFAVGEVEFQVVDAQSLPFEDESFEVITCQFGIMFVPDKDAAIREAFRVLKPGGTLIFTVWDSIEVNECSRVAHEVLEECYPVDPPQFYKIPFGFNDRKELRSLLERNGFSEVSLHVEAHEAESASADTLAHGFLHGSPVYIELEKRTEITLTQLEARLARRFADNFGNHPMRCKIQAVFCYGTKR